MKKYFAHRMRKKSPIEIAGMILLGVAGITALAILFGFVIMWLWNWLMPDIFGLASLTFWQAVGVFILFKLLLGGIGGGNGRGKSSHRSKHKCGTRSGRDFSKWKDYEKFWEEEGDAHFKEYLKRNSKDDTFTESKVLNQYNWINHQHCRKASTG